MTDSNDWLRSHSATIDLHTLEANAAASLDPAIHAYIGRGAGDSVAANSAAWEVLRLKPRLLRDVTEISTATTVLGDRVAVPFMIAPTAMHGLACPDGELATARAAARSGVTYVVSMAATTSIEEITQAAPYRSALDAGVRAARPRHHPRLSRAGRRRRLSTQWY